MTKLHEDEWFLAFSSTQKVILMSISVYLYHVVIVFESLESLDFIVEHFLMIQRNIVVQDFDGTFGTCLNIVDFEHMGISPLSN